MKKIAQGAEAVIYQDKDSIVKDRIEKSYRLPAIDASLRKSRTKREAKILEKLHTMKFPVPKVLEVTKSTITMEEIKGKKLRDVLKLEHAKEIGKKVAQLHKQRDNANHRRFHKTEVSSLTRDGCCS